MTRVQQRFLCWNDWPFESVHNLRRVVHRPRKHPANPIFRDGLAWASVLRDPDSGRFRMWYNTTRGVPANVRGGFHTALRLACAESADGVQWTRPERGLVEGVDPPDNFTNVMMVEGAWVYDDQNEPDPGRRFKLLYDPFSAEQDPILGVGPTTTDAHAYVTRGLRLAVSADGLRWRRAEPGRVLPHISDAHNTLVFDPQHGRYLAYVRAATGDRRVSVVTSRDLSTWDGPYLALEPHEIQTQFYGMVPVPLSGAYAGLVSVFKTEAYDPSLGHMQGTCHIELAHSSDGIAWQRIEPGTPWLDRNPDPEAFDHGICYPMAAVEAGDECHIYYQGIRHTHAQVSKDRAECGLGLATLRRDGFVGLAAGAEDGVLTTRTTASYRLAGPGREWRGKVQWTDFREGALWINAAASRGEVRAELLDRSWQPIPGYERAHSIPFTGDSVRAPLRWRERERLDPPEQLFAIRLIARNAEIFSFGLD